MPRSSLTTNTILNRSPAWRDEEEENDDDDDEEDEGGAPPERRQRRRASWKAGLEGGRGVVRDT